MRFRRNILTILPLLFLLLSLHAGNAPESEEDLDRMVRLLFLSPYNSAGKYEQALAECERKLAELPRDTQSLYPAYCYQNMVYALRGLNRNDELDKLMDRLLRDFGTNLPLLATVSMTDLPSLGFWQDHRFHRAGSGFRGKRIFSLQRHDRARILRAMLDTAWETAQKADPLTRSLYCRNVVKHLAMIPDCDSPDVRYSLADPPGLEPLPLPPQKKETGITDRQRIHTVLIVMKKDAEENPDDPRIRQALQDAQAFADAVYGEKSGPRLCNDPALFNRTGWKPLVHANGPVLSTQYGRWQKDLPDFARREIKRILADPGFDSPSAAEKAIFAILTGQAKPAPDGLNAFFADTMPGFTPEDERGKDPALTAFLLEARLELSGDCHDFLFPPADSAVSFLERRIRSKSFLVKEGKAVWSDSDALAASACARMEQGRSLAPVQRIWPDRANLSPFALAMLARAFPSDMPEYAELKKMLEDSLKDGFSPIDYGAALLFFSEREPRSPLLPVLLKTVVQEECRDFFSLRALIRAVRSGIRAEQNTAFFRCCQPSEVPLPRMKILGDKLVLESGSETAFLKIRLEADSFEDTPVLQSEDGLLVHGSPVFPENGRAVRILCICRLPAGKTVIRIPSAGTLRAENLPVSALLREEKGSKNGTK